MSPTLKRAGDTKSTIHCLSTLPALWWTWASLSASNTDLVHPPTSAEGEGHPSKRSALQEKKKNIHNTYQ